MPGRFPPEQHLSRVPLERCSSHGFVLWDNLPCPMCERLAPIDATADIATCPRCHTANVIGSDCVACTSPRPAFLHVTARRAEVEREHDRMWATWCAGIAIALIGIWLGYSMERPASWAAALLGTVQ